MGITNSNKELSTQTIDCGGTFRVRLSLTAEPDITSNPVDIVLILDRSGSMAGSPMANLKNGARKFIEIIDQSTGGNPGQIGGGSHIGIVSFSDTAVQDTQLITSVAALNAAVDEMTAGGRTNHGDAFTEALDLYNPSSTNAKVMVMFTDGVTTTGPDPAPVAALAKSQGVVIYCIGLNGSGGLDVNALNLWASDPDSTHVAITPDDAELEDLFEDLAENISKPGATNIILTDEVSDCFRILSVNSPTKGSASLVNSQTVRWTIDQLGVTQSEGAVLEFTVEHLGPCSGRVTVNEEITYEDDQDNAVSFPDPQIQVDCGLIICPEGCPEPVSITIGGCEDTLEFNAGDLGLESLGRILQLDVTLKNVCPNRRVAMAVILNEVGDQGQEHRRGMKIITVPAHDRSECHDMTLRCIRFVLPEDLDPDGDCGCICNDRNFRVRFIAHYIDSDFECCECHLTL